MQRGKRLVAELSGPGKPVGRLAGVDESLDSPFAEINHRDLIPYVAGDVGLFTIGVDEDFLRGGWDINRLHNFEGLQIDYGDLVLVGHGNEEPLPVECWARSVTAAGQIDPRLHLIGRRVDDSKTRRCLVGGECHAVITGDRDALRISGDGNDGDGLARRHVED